MRLPTVRVVNLADPATFMTINAADRTAEHELWPEQAEDFDETHLQRSVAVSALDPALRDAAAALCMRLVSFRHRHENREPFASLSPAEQLAALREMGAELDESEARYEDHLRERAAYEASERARLVREQGAAQTSESGGGGEPVLLTTMKGPGGRWYVMRGEERISKGYGDVAEAEIERDRLTVGAA